MILPDYGFKLQNLRMRDWHSSWVVPIFEEALRVSRKPGWHPKTIDLGDNLLLIDLWNAPNERLVIPSGITVVKYEDHPFLKELPTNAPRVVRTLYTKETRLAHTRLKDASVQIRAIDLAEEAWKKYMEGVS